MRSVGRPAVATDGPMELRAKAAEALAVHEARMAAHYPELLRDRPAMIEARQVQCDFRNYIEELDRVRANGGL